MNAPRANIYSQVNNLENWTNWMPWNRKDPAMQIEFNEGPKEGKGATYMWKSEHSEVGNGTMRITESTPDSIATEMTMAGMGSSTAYYKFKDTPDGVMVTWGFDSDGKGTPWYMVVPSKYFSFFMDDMLGSEFEKGLAALEVAASHSTLPGPEATPVNDQQLDTNIRDQHNIQE